MKTKSVVRQKAEATHEFFPRSISAKKVRTDDSKPSGAFIFNKAPINKQEAFKEIKSKVMQDKEASRNKVISGKAASGFLDKLYQDDEEIEELRITGAIDLENNSDIQEARQGIPQQKKRQAKVVEKTSKFQADSKIGKLSLKTGSVGLFAICEITPSYLVVNHTRNTKGYIPISETTQSQTSQKNVKQKKNSYKIGQLIQAVVVREQGQQNFLSEVSDKKHNYGHKIQLSISLEEVNKGLSCTKVTKNMLLQGRVKSKEEKGYLVDLGFKDKSQAFLKFSDTTVNQLEIGQLVQLIVKNVTSSQAIINCQLVPESQMPVFEDCVQQSDQSGDGFQLSSIKPGFLVSGKVTNAYDNGVQVSFLGGVIATCFTDHLQNPLKSYKPGSKVLARVISVDPQLKKVAISLKDHILSWTNFSSQLQNFKIGEEFSDIKVDQLTYGESFILKVKGVNSFLHKSQLKEFIKNQPIEQEGDSDDQFKKKVRKEQEPIDLNIGSVLPLVKIKEFNYFDGTPILTARPSLLSSYSINFEGIKVGQFIEKAKIVAVNQVKKYVTLAINDFVKGNLHIEHMSDKPMKTIPPKLSEVGKEIKVRVFEVNPTKRYIEFTKKDSFLKEDCPCVFERGIVDVKQGDKFFGVIIARNEFGYILKGFGGVKALLTFTETEAELKKSEQSELKVGSLITAYCLFKKNDKGIALTLNKKKVKTLEKVIVPKQKSDSLKSQLPNQEQINQLISKHQHAQLIEQPLVHIGSVRQFKISKKQINEDNESDDENKFNFLVFESTDNENDQNTDNEKVITVVPKQFLPENFSKQNKKQIYEGYILDKIQSNLKEKGCIFISTLKKEHFKVQKPALNDQTEIKIGEQVKCKVQLIKEYGIIAQIIEPEQSIIQTGFMINQQLQSDKKPKVGQEMSLVVLDIDHQKKIADLGERVCTGSSKEKKQKKFEKQHAYKATVELNKDSYLVLSIPKLNNRIAFCVLPSFGQAKHAMKDAQTGEQLEVRILGESEHGHLEAVPYELPSLFNVKKKSNKLTDLSEGCSLTAEIRGIKGEQAFFHLNTYQPGKGILGRLHMIECDSASEFLALKVGQYVSMKILKTVHNLKDQESSKRQWLELTMKSEHLKLPDGQLEAKNQQRSTITLTQLKEGEILEGAIVVSQGSQVFNFKSSHPLCVQVSPMLRVQIPFDQIISSEDFLKFGSSLLTHQFKVGQQIPKLYYLGKSKFSLIDQKAQTLKKGDLVTARFVSVVAGCRGITVQISSNEDGLCGFIETCEITDELIGDVFRAIEERNIFCARIIDRDSNGRWQLSARESVVDPKKWAKTLASSATSKEFMDFDAVNQSQANMRNKILKYGPSVALSRGDLCLGYVVNIGKSGCFIQIGHNCVVRAGLNELSDQSNFDFVNQVPVGRLVVGRITKVEDSKGSTTALAGNEKRFNFSIRESLIVHGVGAVERSKLKIGDEVNSIVMEIADGKAFSQIKGSYIKIKVKPIVQGQGKNSVQIGDLVVSKLTKVTKEKISSEYQSHVKDSGRERTEDEKISESLLKIVQGETKKAIQQSKVLQTQQNKLKNSGKGGQDFDPEQVIINRPINQEDEIAQQIEDLKQLRKQADSSEDEVEDSDDEMQGIEDDSDEAEMKRIMKMDEEDDEDEEDKLDDNEEAEDENMEEDSNLQESSAEQDEDNEEASNKEDQSSQSSSKPVLKKRNLKERVREEEKIRAKEKRMRSATDQPKDIDDFERMLQSSSDQSYLWIQYMAFMLDNLGIEAARKVADRAVKAIPMTAEQEKLNVWTALMNLESNFGTQQTLEEVTARALEVNDRKKVYLNLIDIMKQAGKEEYVEGIYKQLCKKYGKDSVDLWVMYLEFLIETKNSGKKVEQISDSKPVLARALQSLPKDQHVSLISRIAQTECKTGQMESGRTMFEGIVSNYPKRFDIWSVYMDMEMKYGQQNQAQARHLFERCLSNDHIRRKAKKMKLVFQKYMEFESKVNNKSNLAKLRQRAEEYINSMAQEQSESD